MKAASDSLDLPRPFGPYVLLRRLAVGGMAEVYVARARGIQGFEKLVAIKVIHPRYSEDEHFIQLLVEEAKISVLLTHVNIGQIFDLGVVEGTYYIAMEYIEGADGYRLMRKAADAGLKIPVDIAAFIVAEACNGLDHAHRKRDMEGRPMGIVHRDVSPQNVLLSFAGEVKIVDFGIAKAASRSEQTEAGVIKGKYYYMSPEQAWGDPLDLRSDVFSLGVVLYELLIGEMLYQEDNVPMLLDRVRKAEIAPPTTRRADVPRELSDIVMRALKKSPDQRWPSAHDMSQALMQFVYGVSPSFTSQRISDLMAVLFPDEIKRAAELAATAFRDAESDASISLPPMRKDEFAPSDKSAIFDLGDDGDDDEEDITRHDLLPYKQMKAAQQSEAQQQAIQRALVPSVAPKPAAAAPAARPATPAVSATRPAPERRSYEDDEDDEDATSVHQRGAGDDWDESTLIDEKLAAQRDALRARAAQGSPAPPRSAPAPAPPLPPAGLGRPAGVVSAAPRPPTSSARPPPEGAILPPSRTPQSPFDPVGRVAPPPPRDVSWPPAPTRSVPPPAAFSQPPQAPAVVFASPPTGAMDTAGYAAQMHAPTTRPRTWWLAAAALVVLVAVGGAASWWLGRPLDPTLEIDSIPPGASVTLDGVTLPGRTPVVIQERLDPSRTVRVVVTLEHYRPWTGDIRPQPGTVRHVAVLAHE